MMHRYGLQALAVALIAVSVSAGTPVPVLDMDTVRHRMTEVVNKDKQKVPAGTVELTDGKFGKACRFTFVDGARSGFATATIPGDTSSWDSAAGLRFWVKGDGSASWGGLELIDASDFSLRYGVCFPIDSTDWTQITVPWRDVIPEMAGPLVDATGGYAPSRFRNLWFGKWYYWRDYPAHSFVIDQIELLPQAEDGDAPPVPATTGTTRVLARLKAKEPVIVVTMGDSLSDKRHWANKEHLWSEALVRQLQGQYGSEVKLVNPAMGGTTLNQNLILMPRWLRHTPQPDLVIVWSGYNDWDCGVRGPRFREYLSMGVDRIRRMTRGRADVLLATTCPAHGRWDPMNEMCRAVYEVAKEKKAGFADVATAFHAAGSPDAALKQGYWAWDKTHLGAKGHDTACTVFLQAIQSGGTADLEAATRARWHGQSTASAPRRPAVRHAVLRRHPYLLGTRAELAELARKRPEAYRRTARVARGGDGGDWERAVSQALVSAIERDGDHARRATKTAMELVNGPIRRGHVTFGHDLALDAVVYDLCFDAWTDEQRARFHAYVNATVDANVRSETHVFHNGWYGYKNWGIGLAGYATYHENPRAPAILKALEKEYRERAAPALELAGRGGGWAEGYYIHYWLYEWLFFCDVARRCEGVDYCAEAPAFYRQRAVASMFEMYPGIRIYDSRRPVPMGDGGGRQFGGDRDKALSARRMLVNAFWEDAAHQAVHTFNETTPRSSVGNYAYKDFLWRDPTVKKGDLSQFRLSHISPGPGFVYARSSWDEDATYFFFKCGERFTAHQHLDVGHFVIYKHEELVGDGGHYDGFGTPHDVNYHLRTIAHNTVLVKDPSETWPRIRAGKVTGNDGGQHHAWPHHNGAVVDPKAWQEDRRLYDIADIVAFEDRGEYMYVAGDCSRAYSSRKLEYFTRQIVFLRPGTFIVFDRVKARKPSFVKTWLLQAMRPPTSRGPHLVITNGKGRLFVQTLLPKERQLRLANGSDLYRYGGQSFPPQRSTGPAPECRIEVAPTMPASVDYFLHVLTATEAGRQDVQVATVRQKDTAVEVVIGHVKISFDTHRVGGAISFQDRPRPFIETVLLPQAAAE
ncbi:heparinase II/III family protein [bacterium]|nr:heparinase II/III family protein [bacterium]